MGSHSDLASFTQTGFPPLPNLFSFFHISYVFYLFFSFKFKVWFMGSKFNSL